MSQENLEALRSVYDGYSRGDFRPGVRLLDPNVVMVVNPGFPDPGAYLGVEALAAYTRSAMLETWTDLTLAAENLVAVGDSVLVDVAQRGTGTSSGTPAAMRYFTLWSFRGGKVIRIESFRDRTEALEAAGITDA
jgi:ketosteroid isomerase-like protein